MSTRQSDCPPLLNPGEHRMSIQDVIDLCVEKFSLSSTRKPIMDGFLKIVEMLREQKIICELIVDGSYLTEEIEPEDIDFAVVVTPEYYGGCTTAQRKLLDWIGDDKTIKQSHRSDCYLCVDYKQGHDVWFDGICDRGWWVNLYSKSVVHNRIRGVAIVDFPGE